MANISGTPTISGVDLYTSSPTRVSGYQVGDLIFGQNGKGFRYSLNGVAALVMGNLVQASAIDTTYTNMVVAVAGAVGDTSLRVTNGTATITSQQFEGGSLSVYTAGTVAVGDEYTILAVTGTLTTGGALTVHLDRPLRAIFSTSATVNMRRSPWSGVIQSIATTITGSIAGVAPFAATASEYCWLQTKGVGAVLSDGSSIIVGSGVVGGSTATAGACTLQIAGFPYVGMAMQAAAAGKAIAVKLQID